MKLTIFITLSLVFAAGLGIAQEPLCQSPVVQTTDLNCAPIGAPVSPSDGLNGNIGENEGKS